MNKIIRKIDEEILSYKELQKSTDIEGPIAYQNIINGMKWAKAIIQAEQKEPTEEDLKERYYQAREIIKEFCQFEDCQDGDCRECPHPLSTIRCSEEWEFKEREPKTNGDRIRESNESLVEYLSGVILTLNKDVVLEWLDEPVSEDN